MGNWAVAENNAEPVGSYATRESALEAILDTFLRGNNPLGMFAPTNPNVSCDGFDFALLEKPTKMMPGP